MPSKTVTTAETVAHALDARLRDQVQGEASVRDVTKVTGLKLTTAQELLTRYGPVADAWRTTQTAFLLGMWQSILAGVLVRLHDAAMPDGTMPSKEAKDWAIVGGIATEKVLLLDGKPTSIVANLHEVRVSIPELAGRLAEVSRRVALPARSGSEPLPVEVSARVIPPDS